jgi:transmembrane sensor
MLMGVFLCAGLFWPATEIYRTVKGGHTTVTLAEGSTIELGPDSEVKVSLSLGWRTRTLRLERGEALFTVAHDPDRPFEVTASGGLIRDIGTVFDVNVDDGQVSVAVIEGAVGIILGAEGIPYHLDAGQRLSYRATGAVVSSGPANLEAVTAWRTGKLLFEDQPLAKVLSRISRYHDVEFDVTDPALAELKVSGAFEAKNLPVLLATIEATLPVKTKRISERRILVEQTEPN